MSSAQWKKAPCLAFQVHAAEWLRNPTLMSLLLRLNKTFLVLVQMLQGGWGLVSFYRS